MSRAQILDTFTALAVPFQLAPPWDFVPADPDARQIPPDPNSLLDLLVNAFDRNDLLASHVVVLDAQVVVPDADGNVPLQLNPKLICPGAPVLGLRDAETGKLFDLLTTGGLVCTDEPSAFVARRDRHTVRFLSFSDDYEPSVLVAADLRDVILLRALDLPATLADGFDRSDARFLETFRSNFRQVPMETGEAAPPTTVPVTNVNDVHDPPPASATPAAILQPVSDETQRAAVGMTAADLRLPALMLVGWNPSTMSFVEPTSFRNVVGRLRELEHRLNIEIERVEVWIPTAKEREAFRHACDRRDRLDVRAAMVTSLDDATDWSGYHARRLQVSPPVPIDTLAAAIEQLRTAFGPMTARTKAEKPQQKAIADYYRIVDRDLIGSLVDEAATTDPVERNLRAMLAHKVRRYHELVVQGFQTEWERRTKVGMPQRNVADLKEMIALENDLMKTIQELKKWLPHSMMLFPPAPAARSRNSSTDDSQPFAGSDSENGN
jgi:hypothetical protein